MGISLRQYNHPADFEKVGEFLKRTYRTSGAHINWLQPRWEYMHYHPYIHKLDLSCIGIWEANGKIIGVAHPEHKDSAAYFEIDPGYYKLKSDMLKYAEDHMNMVRQGVKQLYVYINDRDRSFQKIASDMGYVTTEFREPMSRFAIPDPFPPVSVPDGFVLKTLEEKNDLREVDRVIWRGFNHGDEPPEGAIEERKFMQSAPNFRKDLQIVVEAPDGHFVSYCGMWYEPINKIAYVEPVATDPDYRMMGLGKAAVLEGVRRSGKCGATVAYVGSTYPIYISAGFRQMFNCTAWLRKWE
jgi:predicted N-acetyltransferase YhbS